MIGIVKDGDLIRIPRPAVTVTDIVWGYREVKASKPESAGTATANAPYVAAPKASRESPVFPRMIQVVMNISAPGIMANPHATVIYVRSVRMSCAVIEVAILFCWTAIFDPRRSSPRNVFMASANLWSASVGFVLSYR
jgi:hypothetical protein